MNTFHSAPPLAAISACNLVSPVRPPYLSPISVTSLSPTSPITSDIAEFHSLLELTIAREEILENILDTQEILVERVNVFEDALKIYEDNSILKCKLYVKFKDEEGYDFNGLTREFFSEFWKKFLETYGKGDSYKYTSICSDNIPSVSLCISAGRILHHRFLMTDYLPINMNEGTLLKILTNKDPSEDLLVSSFLKFFAFAEEKLLSEYLSETVEYTNDKKIRITNILSNFSLKSIPSSSCELNDILKKLSKFEILISPFYMLCNMYVSNEINDKITQHVMLKRVEQLKPSGNVLSGNLVLRFSEEPTSYGLEERVFGYIERFVQTLSIQKSQDLMKYVSGSEVSNTIFVSFHGITNSEEMLPKSHTCSVELEVSRFFTS